MGVSKSSKLSVLNDFIFKNNLIGVEFSLW